MFVDVADAITRPAFDGFTKGSSLLWLWHKSYEQPSVLNDDLYSRTSSELNPGQTSSVIMTSIRSQIASPWIKTLSNHRIIHPQIHH